MHAFEQETQQLIDALPVPGDRHQLEVHGGCPLAYDASGTRNAVFETAALDEGVAEHLRYSSIYPSSATIEHVKVLAGYNDRTRVSEHIKCLLSRALGLCPTYDADERRERSGEEALAIVRAKNG